MVRVWPTTAESGPRSEHLWSPTGSLPASIPQRAFTDRRMDVVSKTPQPPGGAGPVLQHDLEMVAP